MSRPVQTPAIRLRGVRQNNLKNFDLDLPMRQLVVITGLSGSGKSSLAFDTLFAEGQRRYIETFSPYARQFFDRMDKPQVDRIEGIPPAIAIEQRNSVRSTRSTVGTMTEICEYLKLAWPALSRLHCRECGRPVRQEPPSLIWSEVSEPAAGGGAAGRDLLVSFELPLSEKLPLGESLELIARQGYQRLLLEGQPVRIEEAAARITGRTPASLTVLQDRLRIGTDARSRFVEACEQAYHFGKGHLTLWEAPAGGDGTARLWRRYSSRFHCAGCDIDYREPSPALFSFNHPVGACPACKGFGRIIGIDYRLAIPDRTKTLAGGLVKPWQTGVSAECQRDLMRACKASGVPTQVPFCELSPAHQDWVLNGEPGYGSDEEHEWPRAWYGVKGYFRWLESKSYKMHVRVLLSRYRSYTTCGECQGRRFQPESLLYQASWPPGVPPPDWLPAGALGGGAPPRITLADVYRLPVSTALPWAAALLAGRPSPSRDPLGLVLREIHSRLRYLAEVGLGYLTLDRPTRSLSGGETERVNLTTCLGTRLVNTLFVLDEPSVGLHPRDTARLVRILQTLRDAGNTVVVVEHEASVMMAADQIIDLGPGQGERGGEIVYQGSYQGIVQCARSLTGLYLSGRKGFGPFPPRPVSEAPRPASPRGPGKAGPAAPVPWLRIEGARGHNLRGLDVAIPLGRLVCLTGVSGSGKTTLVRDVLLPALQDRLARSARGLQAPEATGEETPDPGEAETEGAGGSLRGLVGWESIDRVVLVDQTSLGRTPRSNPVVYVGAFEHVRDLFAETELAQRRGLGSSAFSFNSAQGQCERCRGAGFEKIEMQFLSDVFIRCPDCNGRRYREHILEVKLSPPGRDDLQWSIADTLEATIDDAITFLKAFPGNRHAVRGLRSLELLQQVGLGYLRLGQPINTLSGGESQRLKLVSYLAETAAAELGQSGRGEGSTVPRTLFLFDEPTTGLHFDDVRVLLQVFQRLVDAGHSVLVIEHN
ncbi:MAG TPA: excinuclease ABC subunit A, partial [Verrucomicrobiales bacterium]|nr:excinuclease ABC subunit A [Verrucomicrobiales bacterium]